MGLTDIVFGRSKLKLDLYNSRQEIIVLRQDVQRLENQMKISEEKRNTVEVRNEYLVDIVKDASRNLGKISSKIDNAVASLTKQDEKKEDVSVMLPQSMRSMRPPLKEELDQAENRLKRVH